MTLTEESITTRGRRVCTSDDPLPPPPPVWKPPIPPLIGPFVIFPRTFSGKTRANSHSEIIHESILFFLRQEKRKKDDFSPPNTQKGPSTKNNAAPSIPRLTNEKNILCRGSRGVDRYVCPMTTTSLISSFPRNNEERPIHLSVMDGGSTQSYSSFAIARGRLDAA